MYMAVKAGKDNRQKEAFLLKNNQSKDQKRRGLYGSVIGSGIKKLVTFLQEDILN